jgi:hypothetical protein
MDLLAISGTFSKQVGNNKYIHSFGKFTSLVSERILDPINMNIANTDPLDPRFTSSNPAESDGF